MEIPPAKGKNSADRSIKTFAELLRTSENTAFGLFSVAAAMLMVRSFQSANVDAR